MKTQYKSLVLFPLVTVVMSFYILGCNMVTEPNKQTGENNTSDHLVINEVFTLPSTQYDAYSWIELYNPTSQRIGGLHKWSLEYTADTKTSSGADTTITVRAFLRNYFTYGIPDTLEPGYFLVLAGDSVNLMDHTNLGGGHGMMVQFNAPHFMPDRSISLSFLLSETGQIALVDTSGNFVDVVRYGNYVPTSPDPFPGNHSAGMIPEWYSLSRYAYAYSTGNSADDFYMEKTPTPLWYNEQAHP